MFTLSIVLSTTPPFSIQQSLEYLNSLRQEHYFFLKPNTVFSLQSIKRVLKGFGNPEKKLNVIHVAGSKGKGSVSVMIASMVQAAGYKVGLFTSPHLSDFRERIRMNGKVISKKDFAAFTSMLSSCSFSKELTYFEFLTVFAILYFVHCKVDYAVFEVGLGGRLDATNVVHPIATVLTQIEFEHTSILGNTVEKIAHEKLGIVKQQIPLFIARQANSVIRLAKKKCAQMRSECYFLGEEVNYEVISRRLKGYVFRCSLKDSSRFTNAGSFDCIHNQKFKISFLGDHQVANACLSLLVMRRCFPHIPTVALQRGLHAATWAARFEYEIIDRVPVIYDVAHTPSSIRAFLRTYEELFGQKRKVYLISLFKDKRAKDIFTLLKSSKDVFIMTSSDSPRAFSGEHLQQLSGYSALSIENPRDAFQHSLDIARKNKACLSVIGSHGHIGEIRAHFMNHKGHLSK